MPKIFLIKNRLHQQQLRLAEAHQAKNLGGGNQQLLLHGHHPLGSLCAPANNTEKQAVAAVATSPSVQPVVRITASPSSTPGAPEPLSLIVNKHHCEYFLY